MSLTERAFDELWNVEVDFKLSDSGLPVAWSYSLCPSAKKYAEWANKLCSTISEDPSPVGVNQAMLQLTKTYFGWRSVVPKQHRDYIGDRGHVCVFQVFVYFFQRLREVELTISPQVIVIQRQPQYQIDGIFLGEED